MYYTGVAQLAMYPAECVCVRGEGGLDLCLKIQSDWKIMYTSS